jgi:hypothetical protein
MLKPQPIPEIPAETVRVVRAAFPNGNLYIHLRDTLGTIYQDELFADLYPGRGGCVAKKKLICYRWEKRTPEESSWQSRILSNGVISRPT